MLDPWSVDLWLADLDVDVGSAESILSPDEVSRASRLLVEVARRRFVLSRAALREILASYLGSEPWKIAISYADHGKPSLDRSGPRFNVSHSGTRALIAVSEREVGVDIEGVRRLRDAEAVSRRYYSPRELAQLGPANADGEWLNRFYVVWTRKEACLKTVGLGLRFELRDICVAGPSPVTTDVAGHSLVVHDVDVGGDYRAAAATHEPGIRLRTWKWSSETAARP